MICFLGSVCPTHTMLLSLAQLSLCEIGVEFWRLLVMLLQTGWSLFWFLCCHRNFGSMDSGFLVHHLIVSSIQFLDRPQDIIHQRSGRFYLPVDSLLVTKLVFCVCWSGHRFVISISIIANVLLFLCFSSSRPSQPPSNLPYDRLIDVTNSRGRLFW